MKNNWNIAILGDKVLLVPYTKQFVLQYHEWMKSEEILEMTASEPLSLEEEYEMQNSWKNDEKKCTFILLSRHPFVHNNPKDEDSETRSYFAEDSSEIFTNLGTPSTKEKEISMMVGDVNLFINDYYDPHRAEIEIMIAEVNARRAGIARQALVLMMDYAISNLNIHTFYAKINEVNVGSINLFKSLNFEEINYVPAFREFEFELRINISDDADRNLRFLRDHKFVLGKQILNYHHDDEDKIIHTGP